MKRPFYILFGLLLLVLCGCYDWERDAEGTLGDPANKRLIGSKIYDAITDAPKAVVFRDMDSGTLIYDDDGTLKKVPFVITGDGNDIITVEVDGEQHDLKFRRNTDETVSVKEIGSDVWVRYAKPQ